jgi:hypothetical protein
MREDMKSVARMIAARLVQFSTTDTSTASGHGDTFTGRSLDDGQQSPIPSRRMWPFGIRSRPPRGVDCIVVKANGGSNQGVMVGAESDAYGPSDLADGETAIYSKAFAHALVADKDGNTKIASDTANSKNVIVNGGTRVVVLDQDHVDCGTLTLTLADSGGTPVLSYVYVDGQGNTTTGSTSAGAPGTPLPIKGVVTGSAQNFKAV